MSGFARSETANLVSVTSGTERKRGFVGNFFACAETILNVTQTNRIF